MQKWPWKLYGVFLTSITTHEVISTLIPNSPLITYYTILIGFNKYYILLLAFNLLNIFINWICVLAVFYYAFNVKTVSSFWKILFVLRIVFDLIGNNYNLQFIKASFFQSFSYGFILLGFSVLPLIPSYIAHYRYIFQKK